MKHIFLILSVIFLGFGCAQKNNNNTNTTPVYVMTNGACYDQTNRVYVATNLCSNSGFSYVNGVCIQTSTNTQYPANYCQNTTSGFSYVNGVCVQTTTGVQYPANYCQNSGGQQCYGLYYYYNQMYGQYQQVQCQGSNCSGQNLVNPQTNQQVYCQ